MAFPSKFTPELWNEILDRMRDGQVMNAIYKAVGVGSSTVCDWRKADPQKEAEYQAALYDGSDAINDSTITIADNLAEDPASRKVRIYARREYLKTRDDRFRDKVRNEHSGPDGGAIQVTSFKLAPLE